ncbi:MAG: hypothetical protein K0R18_1677 [Bacillales bacterium]|jgi:hypothetical protein|nr:hypothetical protein [Bacillales bacterium]
MEKPIIKYNKTLKAQDLFTIYAIVRNTLVDSNNEKLLEKINKHMANSKSQSETLKIIQMYVTFERQ